MKKIDIHCHTTNRKIKDAAEQAADIDTICQRMREFEVDKTVVLATYFPHKGSGISNFRLLHWIQNRPEFCMFGSLDFEFYFHQGMNELTELAEKELIKGIKIYTCYQNIDLNSDKFKKVIALAKRFSLPIMFHCGYSYSSRRKYGTVAITEVVKPTHLKLIAQENPEVNLIISHLSKPFVDDLILFVKKNYNVYADMSGLMDSKYDRNEIPDCVENIRRFLNECGPDRLLFGTDFPVQTHDDSVFFIEYAMKDFPDIDKQIVYFNNAARLLRYF